MVQGIIAGTKTQTRRICKPIPFYDEDNRYVYIDNLFFDIHDKWDIPMYLKDNSKYQIGDVLWVRETFCPPLGYGTIDHYIYKASIDLPKKNSRHDIKWKPSIFMPKAACRIKLLVKNIRVERLRDISENDAIEEGIEKVIKGYVYHDLYRNYNKNKYNERLDPISSYITLWESVNGKDSWNINPWVFVIEFENVKQK